MNVFERIHGRMVHPRRVGVLAARLAPLLPASGRVLDVGSGDGWVAANVLKLRPALEIIGVDPLVRPESHIPVEPFDGTTLPFADGSFDASLLVDVLHHSDDPEALLGEAVRVSRSLIVIKDHIRDAPLSTSRLRFMDSVSNRRHGVALPHNYWSSARWNEAFENLGIRPLVWERDLGLYPSVVDWVFGGSLHVIAQLQRA